MGVEPTKLTAETPGWARMASTACLSPWTTLKTPLGRPASLSISARRFAELGSRSEGLRMKGVWDAGGDLDILEAAGGFAAGVGEDFAVLEVDEGGDFVEAALEDFAEAEEDAGSAERWLGGPVGEGCGCGGYGGVNFGGGG